MINNFKKHPRVIILVAVAVVLVLAAVLGIVFAVNRAKDASFAEMAGTYYLENPTENQKFMKMQTVSLYDDGTAMLSTPPISSYSASPCTYSVAGNELLIHAVIEPKFDEDAYGVKNGDIIARFVIADNDTLVFKSATVPLFADEGARYVRAPENSAVEESSPPEEHPDSAAGNGLLAHRTEFAGDDSKINAILDYVPEFPEEFTISQVTVNEGAPAVMTVNLKTDTETKDFYSGLIDEGLFRMRAFLLFSLIHELQRVDFVLDDGGVPYTAYVSRERADSFANGDIWAYSATQERFDELSQMLEQIVVTKRYPDGDGLQPLIENEAELNAALNKANSSISNADISVPDTGTNEEIALAWANAWIEQYKALPEDNLAHISDGAVDWISVTKISKEGKPTGFVFVVVISIRPTCPIFRNAFYMAGNTSASPGRNGTWGALGREIELVKGDDGRYYSANMGTGGAGDSEIYELVRTEIDMSDISGLGVSDYLKMFSLAPKTDGAYSEGLGGKLARSFEYDEVTFINELSAWDKNTQTAAVSLLVGEYMIDDSNDHARAKDFHAKLAELQTDNKANQGIVILMESTLNTLAKVNGVENKLSN